MKCFSLEGEAAFYPLHAKVLSAGYAVLGRSPRLHSEVACPEPGQHPSTLFVSWDHLTCTFHLHDWLSPSFPAFLLLFQIRELVPESQAYMDLLAFERKLDQTIMRKRVDIQEALKRPMKVS